MNLKFLQINLGNGREAQDLLLQKATEVNCDIVIISEPYWKPLSGNWYQDNTKRAAILLLNKNLIIDSVCEENTGFVWITVNGVRIYSVYFSPNISMDQFTAGIDELESSIRSAKGKVIIGGDFNSKSPEWNSGKLDKRGVVVSEMIASLGLAVFNNGNSPTFRRGQLNSIVDITMGSDSFLNSTMNWRVLEDLTLSDHQYIEFSISNWTQTVDAEADLPKWNVRKLDERKFNDCIRRQKERNGTFLNSLDDDVGLKVNFMVDTIKKACDASMPRIQQYNTRRQPVYWWTNEIGVLRKKCLAARRRSTRNPDDDRLKEEYKMARKVLRAEIRKSKREKWKELCEEVDIDPWGKPYKIITKKIGNRKPIPGIKEPNWAAEIVKSLFPVNTRGLIGSPKLVPTVNITPFNIDELLAECKKLKNGKSPGPDGIPNEALRLVSETWPELLLQSFNACVQNGVYPQQWKIQKLVLLRKEKKPLNEPSSYRPLCMLDTLGKLLERLLLRRLESEIETSGGLSPRQYGFRKGKSTVDAINEVVETAAITKAAKGFCAIITLDVKNAFNTVRWDVVLDALRKRKVNTWLYNMIVEYLSTRILLFETTEGMREYNITAGVPQGSVLGPFLWNVMYDGLLDMRLPEGAKLIGYADDVAVIISQSTAKHLEITANDALGRCDRWLRGNGLQLAAAKTEAILVTNRRVFQTPVLKIRQNEVQFGRSLQYLGIILDDKLNFHKHAEYVRDKALKTAHTLARIMPNIHGPKDTTRRLINSTTHSQILYAAPIFASAMTNTNMTKQLLRPQRISALRVISAYRTVSTGAALVIAGIPPIDLLVKERDYMYRATRDRHISLSDAKRDAREMILDEWQNRWSQSNDGRWTFELIKNIRPWMERQHGNVNYFLTQVLTNHGGFNSYLYRFKLKSHKTCDDCGAEDDNAEHTLFQCPVWYRLRNELNNRLNITISKENLIGEMLLSEERWKWCEEFINRIMKHKCYRTPNP